MFIKEYLKKSVEVKEAILNSETLLEEIAAVSDLIIKVYEQGSKVLAAGNGGSAADSQHFACELVSKFREDRRALPAIALSTNTSILTAVGNDFGFEYVFSRQIEALGEKGDVFIGITTSGKSKNVLEALKKAKEKGLYTVVLTGFEASFSSGLCDYTIKVPSMETPVIQEVHISILHAICAKVEKAFL